MAGLFGGPAAPQYEGSAGTALATQPQGGGLFGVFPGTPDYTTASTPPPTGTTPPTGTQAPSIEVAIRVPGLLSVQGSLTLPPWLLESAPALVPLVLQMIRQRIDAEPCNEVPPPPRGDGGGRPCEVPPEVGREGDVPEDRRDWYSRVWP